MWVMRGRNDTRKRGAGNRELRDEGNVRQGRTGLERRNIKETCKRKSERGGWWKELCARNMRNHELMGGNHRWIIE